MGQIMNSRRVLYWERVRGLKNISAVFVGTAGGAGLFPVAPGTMGTLVGMPIAYYTYAWPLAARLMLWTALAALGTWACKEFDTMMGSHDNQNLVIDEVVGVGITAWTAGATELSAAAGSVDWKPWISAFVIFRLFDVIKIPPVRQVDRWSKTGSSWLGGFGVMADDIAAGFQGLLVMILLQKFHIL
jgi:phosphatidylglycerophosphatase A